MPTAVGVIGGMETRVAHDPVGFHWVTADEVKELASEAFAVRVLDAMQQDRPPAIRHHDGTRLLGVPQRHE